MWRMKGEGQHTCLHTHTHTCIHLRYALARSSGQFVCGVLAHLGALGGLWPVLGSGGQQAQHPCGVTLLLLVAQVPGSGSVQLGKGFLKGTSKLLGRPCYLLLISLFGEPALPKPPAECTWGRMTTSNDLDSWRKHLDSGLGKWDFTRGSQDLHREG